MPILNTSAFRPFPGTANGHLQTLIPACLPQRRLRNSQPLYHREQLNLKDGDFVDLDWLRGGNRRTLILCHGLEGSSGSTYMRGLALAATAHAFDALSWNYRGCGGTPNRHARSYHSGATEDLREVIEHVVAEGYEKIVLVGFSLGGNLILKYLGENPQSVPTVLKAAVAVSPPCDLRACAYLLTRWNRKPYLEQFMRSLRKKMFEKARRFPQQIAIDELLKVRDFIAFDNRFTAPLHGFADAEEYWAKASSKQFIAAINVPTLILTAEDDPLLTPSCIPEAAASASEAVHLELTPSGGHVGFVQRAGRHTRRSYVEQRVFDFLQDRQLAP